jgi:putative ABC transport system ATP-binding protein
MSTSIEIKNLEFAYSGQKPVLQIPELRIQPGEIVFLYGPSGTGKSTLLEILAGVIKADSGDVLIAGKNLTKLSSKELDSYRAENVGYIFQSFNLIPYLSVSENILLPSLFKPQQNLENLLNHMLEALGLKNFSNKKVSELSVGQQQRVAVARALIKNPNLILADEPTSALDYEHREKFLKLLFSLCRERKTTVVFVSHDLSMQKLFDRSLSLAEINKVNALSEESL